LSFPAAGAAVLKSAKAIVNAAPRKSALFHCLVCKIVSSNAWTAVKTILTRKYTIGCRPELLSGLSGCPSPAS
jgi:hypothetical protein